MSRTALIVTLLWLAGCTAPGTPAFFGRAAAPPPLPGEVTFAEVAARVGPVAEALCRDRGIARNCNFHIVIDTRDGPPNAFQTVDRAGRPILGFSAALIAEAWNADEMAFVMGHEASHHIQGHIPQREQAAVSGAMMGAILARAQGLDPQAVERAGQVGAEMGARQFSKDFELEADRLGTLITLRAGYDAVRGSEFFDRLPDPGNRFLGTHPANAQRKTLVRETQAALLGGS